MTFIFDGESALLRRGFLGGLFLLPLLPLLLALYQTALLDL